MNYELDEVTMYLDEVVKLARQYMKAIGASKSQIS